METTISLIHRLIGLLIDIAVIGGFSMIWLFGGHGAAPVGVMMFLGQGDWHLPMAVGWTGIAALILLPLIPYRWFYAMVAMIGLGFLTVSLIIFINRSEAPGTSMLLAVYFVGAVIGRVVYLVHQIRQRRVA